MKNFIFHSPYWLLLSLAIPLLVWLRGRRTVSVLFVPFAASWHRRSLLTPSRWPIILAVAGISLLIVAAARPQRIEDRRESNSQGYDLMLAIDLSGSMLSEDFERGGQRINRLQVIKPVIQAFINKRPSDRIGIVVFSGRAYTLSPLTHDHDWLADQVERLKIGLIEDGTAIGDGLGVALTRLEQAERESGGHRLGAFVVLLTDGANNRGAMTPEQATEIAKARAIPVYTIGAGREGSVPYPVFDQNNNRIGSRRVPSDLDEPALREIASKTGGRYFRADDVHTVEEAFASIDRAKKIEFQTKSFLITTELFWIPAAVGAALFLLGAVIAIPGANRARSRGPTSTGTKMAGRSGTASTVR